MVEKENGRETHYRHRIEDLLILNLI